MVQNKEIEEKVLVNGQIKIEENGETESEKLNGEDEESDDDDYLDHLLALPLLNDTTSCRNKSLVAKTLLDFCTAIESKKEYQKIKQELLQDSKAIECKQETEEVVKVSEQQEEKIIEEEKPPPQEELTNGIVTPEQEVEPVIRRQSIRLQKAQFVPEHAPAVTDQFFVCRRCTIFFQSRKLRKIHNMTCHRRKPNGLEEAVPVDTLKKRQRRSSSNKDPFICDLCEKVFKKKALLRSHMNTHLTEPQFFCSMCPYASKRNNDLKKHNGMHHNPDRIVKNRIRLRKCDKCELILDGKKALKLHIREKHPPEEIVKRSPLKPRVLKKVCEKCDEVIEGMKAYKRHIKEKHSEISNIRCEMCHRKFKTNFRLKKHKLKYSEVNMDCRTYFRSNGDLKTFDCPHCDKKFSLKSHLTLHSRKHLNLTCNKCNVTFKNKFNLKWHEFSHLEIEPKCTNCFVSFTSEQKFSVHLKKKICMPNGAVNGAIVAT